MPSSKTVLQPVKPHRTADSDLAAAQRVLSYASDALIALVPHTGDVLADLSYQGTATVKLPAVVPGWIKFFPPLLDPGSATDPNAPYVSSSGWA